MYVYYIVTGMRRVNTQREHNKAVIEGYIVSLEEEGLPVPEERFETFVVCV